ncbi:MFS transporter [Mycobacterium sp. 1164985.4]|uniref:MFS transporter n=1 Tax=Mycobacterium sp. 1164985.4 TaxID=1834069 RepID=UPI00080011AE|nr:MFS transporter [Mycobacterium sp. 1164985.4]OBK76834.1 MFS transporter [Mycobacterium sp. 1164985.4]
MAARYDAERAVPHLTTEPANLSTPMAAERTAPRHRKKYAPTRLPPRRFIAAIIAIGSMELMAAMELTIGIVALPKVQNDMELTSAGRSWVIFATLLTANGLMLVGGRLGDTIGRKRAFVIGVALSTFSSLMCGLAWNETVLIVGRLLKGVSVAILAPTCLALVATTFPKGQLRNTATAVFGAMVSIGSVMGLIVGGILTDLSWRLAVSVAVPIGLLALFLARTALRETQKERMKLDATGALLTTLGFTAVVLGFSMGPEWGWLSPATIGSGVAALSAFVAFAVVERRADNPVVPFDLFLDRNRLATFAALFLTGGVMTTLILVVTVYVQDIMGYSTLRAGVSFIPFALGAAIGMGASSRLVTKFPPRMVVIAGCTLLLIGVLYGSTLNRGTPYLPNLALPIAVGGIGIGMVTVPLVLSVITTVGYDRIGPTSAIAVILQGLGGPVVLAVIQAVITSRTLHLGGTSGPAKNMNPAQLNALDHGYTYGLLWLSGVVVLLGVAALFIRYTAEDVARAQEAKKAVDAQRL